MFPSFKKVFDSFESMEEQGNSAAQKPVQIKLATVQHSQTNFQTGLTGTG